MKPRAILLLTACPSSSKPRPAPMLSLGGSVWSIITRRVRAARGSSLRGHRDICRCFGKEPLAQLRLPACRSQRVFVRLAPRFLFATASSQATRGSPRLQIFCLHELNPLIKRQWYEKMFANHISHRCMLCIVYCAYCVNTEGSIRVIC